MNENEISDTSNVDRYDRDTSYRDSLSAINGYRDGALRWDRNSIAEKFVNSEMATAEKFTRRSQLALSALVNTHRKTWQFSFFKNGTCNFKTATKDHTESRNRDREQYNVERWTFHGHGTLGDSVTVPLVAELFSMVVVFSTVARSVACVECRWDSQHITVFQHLYHTLLLETCVHAPAAFCFLSRSVLCLRT